MSVCVCVRNYTDTHTHTHTHTKAELLGFRSYQDHNSSTYDPTYSAPGEQGGRGVSTEPPTLSPQGRGFERGTSWF